MSPAWWRPILAVVGGALAIWLRWVLAGRRWSVWLVTFLVVGGGVSALVVRGIERAVLASAVPTTASEAKLFEAICALGITAPVSVLLWASVLWLVLLLPALEAERETPLLAVMTATGSVLARTWLRSDLTGTPFVLLGVDDLTLAMVLGSGIAQSARDGSVGGTPFGRYAAGTIFLRGVVEVALLHGLGGYGVVLAEVVPAIGVPLLGWSVVRAYRSDERADASGDRDSTTDGADRESWALIARRELARGRLLLPPVRGLRPLWILAGTLATVGMLIVALVAVALVGAVANVDFGQIDWGGSGAEYAALLLALGVAVAFPASAMVVGAASGRAQAENAPHVLEAGLSAVLALFGLLAVLGVVAPVAAAIGVTLAPVAFVLAGLGAWVTAGRRM